MRKPFLLRSLIVLAGVAATLVAFPGCEDSPDMPDLDAFFANNPYFSDPRTDGQVVLKLTPESANITYKGETVNFRVQGGQAPYRWAVANTSRGSVIEQPAASSTTIYTVSAVGPNSVIVADSIGHSAIADITATAAGALRIIPSTTTLTAAETNGVPVSLHGTIVNFQVTGGVAPYGSWKVTNPNLGTISASGVYTVDGTWGTGANTVSISDSAGATATATVTTQLAGLAD